MRTTKQTAQFIQLRAGGRSFDAIAKELQVSKQTAINWSKELEEEIATKRAVELEALYEEYNLTKEGRLQRLGSLLNRLQAEVESRDLSEVPTEKLIALLLKTSEQAEKEALSLSFKDSEEQSEEREERLLLKQLSSTKNVPELDYYA
jgi:predicted ArsR family transcriptional regulator